MPARPSVLPSRFRYRLSPVNMRRGLWLALGSLAILVVLSGMASGNPFTDMLDDLRRQPAWALAMATLGVVVLAMLLGRIVAMTRDAWLVVDSEGFRCSPPRQHGPRNWLRHEWQLPWSAIERAIVRRPGPGAHNIQNWVHTTLTLETTQGRHDMALLNWDPADDPLDRPGLMTWRPGRRLHELTETHPLVEHLTSRGIEVAFEGLGVRERLGLARPAADRPAAADSEGPVDILAYKSLVIMLAILGALGIAAAAHFTMLPPIRALWSPAYAALVLAGCVVFVLGALLPRSAPVRERTVIALLLGAAVGALAHPLTVRLQSMTGEEPATVEYILETPGQFRPVNARHPTLNLRDLNIPEYWSSLAPGETHPFDLQPIAEGRSILHLDPLFERTRAYYENTERD